MNYLTIYELLALGVKGVRGLRNTCRSNYREVLGENKVAAII